MKTSFKKLVAGASIVALVAMNIMFTNAATPTGLISGDTVTISDTRFDGTENNTDLTVYVTGTGATDASTQVAIDLSLSGTDLTSINAGNMIFDIPAYASGVLLNISYLYQDSTEPANNFAGAVVINTLDYTQANSHQVRVTATVLPILSFSLSDNDLDLGELNPTEIKSVSLTGTLSTNANGGAKVMIATTGSGTSAGLYDSASDNVIPMGGAVVAGTEGMSLYVDSVSNLTNVGAPYTANAGDSQEMFNTSGPVDGGTAVIKTDAAVSTVTPAGNYSTTYTFTVTGSF